MAAPDAMLFWLARAAKQAREAAGRKQVHIAAEADKDQSTIYRFEQGGGWPRETDRIVAAYAADLEIDPIEIWGAALEMWRGHLDGGDVSELPADELAVLEVERPAPRTRGPARGARKAQRGNQAGSQGR